MPHEYYAESQTVGQTDESEDIHIAAALKNDGLLFYGLFNGAYLIAQ